MSDPIPDLLCFLSDLSHHEVPKIMREEDIIGACDSVRNTIETIFEHYSS